jgi:hypothetical protein
MSLQGMRSPADSVVVIGEPHWLVARRPTRHQPARQPDPPQQHRGGRRQLKGSSMWVVVSQGHLCDRRSGQYGAGGTKIEPGSCMEPH